MQPSLVDSHGLTPVALKKNELDNFSFGIHPRAHARGPLLISIGRNQSIMRSAEQEMFAVENE